MRIEVAVDARDGVGEGPFWDEQEQALWWVDITGQGGTALGAGRPASGDAGRCRTFLPRSCCGRRAAPWWRCAMGSTSSTRDRAACSCSAAPTPTGRTTAATRPSVARGRFLAGHHGQQSAAGRLAAPDDRQHRRALPGARRRQLHPRGRRRRPLQHPGLDRRWPDAAVRGHVDRCDLRLRGPGRRPAGCPQRVQRREAAGLLRRLGDRQPKASCGTRASRAPA